MSTKHTPGPWTVLPEEVDRDYIRVRGTRLGERYKVANVPTVTGRGVPAREADETRANARLIAAAPELLEALEVLEAYVANNIVTDYPTGIDIEGTAFQRARAAIAKATGSAE